MFKVIVEFTDTIIVAGYVVSKNTWYDYLYQALENDNRVEHYTVITV